MEVEISGMYGRQHYEAKPIKFKKLIHNELFNDYVV